MPCYYYNYTDMDIITVGLGSAWLSTVLISVSARPRASLICAHTGNWEPRGWQRQPHRMCHGYCQVTQTCVRRATLRRPSPRSRTSAADRGRPCVWRGPLLLAAGSPGACVTELLCDKVPVWGLLPEGGVYGLNILPHSVFAGRPPGGVPWCPGLQTQGTWNAQRWMNLKPVFCQDLCLTESFSRRSHCDPPSHSTQWG